NSTSRRAFLKTAATMGTAAALGLASNRNATAAGKAQTTEKKKRGNNDSKKIGAIGDQPKSSVFRKLKQRRRMPGWRGDTRDRVLAAEETLYPEQLLRVKDGLYDPFGHVNPNANILKPPPPDPPQDPNKLLEWQQQWLEFNTW